MPKSQLLMRKTIIQGVQPFFTCFECDKTTKMRLDFDCITNLLTELLGALLIIWNFTAQIARFNLEIKFR